MESKNSVMQKIFKELSEANQAVMLLKVTELQQDKKRKAPFHLLQRKTTINQQSE